MSSTVRRYLVIGAACIAALTGAATAFAQNTPGGNMEDNGGLNGSLSRADIEKLNGDRIKERKPDTGRDPQQALAQAKEQSSKLLSALQLSCEISDAQLVVAGTRRLGPGGKEVESRVFEVACGGKIGYLLETQGSEPPVGISCLAAEEARAADVAKQKEPGFFCKLPGNRDVYALVTSLIAAGTGAQCNVQQLRYFGRSESTHSEYSEVACMGGNGFLLRTPLPGSTTTGLAMSCAEAAKQGIKCRMTDAGPVEKPVTLDTFKEALAQHSVTCGTDQLRMIGQEDHRKRYVVEYRCGDPPEGKIAFIPLPGNSNPFETMSCSEAAQQGLACLLGPKQ